MDAPPASSRPHLHILVLNDDQETLERLAGWFEAQGHTTATARLTAMHDPEKDVAHIATLERPDVVVYDVGYPYAENWRLLECLRTKPPLKTVPIVVTTVSRRALEAAAPASADGDVADTNEDLHDLLEAVYRVALPVG